MGLSRYNLPMRKWFAWLFLSLFALVGWFETLSVSASAWLLHLERVTVERPASFTAAQPAVTHCGVVLAQRTTCCSRSGTPDCTCPRRSPAGRPGCSAQPCQGAPLPIGFVAPATADFRYLAPVSEELKLRWLHPSSPSAPEPLFRLIDCPTRPASPPPKQTPA